MIYQLETLDSLIEYNKKFAEDWFKEKGSLSPMIIGYTKDNKKRIVLLGSFTDENEKTAWMLTASIMFRLFDVDKYVVMTEGWMVRDPKLDVNEIYKQYGSLEHYPDRAEGLNVVAVNNYGSKLSISEILPDKTLKPMDDKGFQVSGRMCEILNAKLPPISDKKRGEIIAQFMDLGLGSIEDLT